MTLVIEVPAHLAARIEAAAAEEGMAIDKYVSDILASHLERARPHSQLAPNGSPAGSTEKPWMKYVGIAAGYRDELARIDALIEEAFEQIEEEDWE